MDTDHNIRKHLVNLLQGHGAHLPYADVFDDLDPEGWGRSHASLPWTAWQQLEHMRIAQRDILEFSRDPDHISPDWPDEYWPDEKAPANREALKDSVDAFQQDLREMLDLVKDPSRDLLEPLDHGDGQTLFREALLVADHNACHLGQLLAVRRVTGSW